MKKPPIATVAVVGTGVIGRSWIQVFARAGCRVRAFDRDPEQLARAMAWLKADLKDQRARGLKKKQARAQWERVEAVESLAEALDGAGYVQESGPEQLAAKRALYAELDQAAMPRAIIGSSTSTLDMTAIAEGLRGAGRCIVAHPVNPPHIVPAVEILGGAATEAKVVRRTIKFMAALGQVPILMHRYAFGFVLNRLQSALVREAVHLVQSGVADAEAVDDAIRDGLGLRWALLGPFGVANGNADGGVREYFTRFRASYHELWDDLATDVRFDDALVERIGTQTDRMLPAPLETQRAWRDRLVTGIRALKTDDPMPLARRPRKQPRRGRRAVPTSHPPQDD